MTTATETTDLAVTDTHQSNGRSITIYDRIANPIEAVERLGDFIAGSGMFGFGNDPIGRCKGRVVALTCLTERITPMSFVQTYDIIEGKPSMKASAMLAEFRKRGGDHEVISRTPDRAAVLLKIGRGRGQKSQEFSITWEEAQKEPWPWGKNRQLKHNWATPRSRANMLWARAISEGVRAMLPEVNHGIYTPEEIADIPGNEAVVIDAEFEPADVPPAQREPVAGDAGQAAATAPAPHVPVLAPATRHVEAPAVEPTASGGTDAAPFDSAQSSQSQEDAPGPITDLQQSRLRVLLKQRGLSREQWMELVSKYGVQSANQLNEVQAEELGAKLERANWAQELDEWVNQAVKSNLASGVKDQRIGQLRAELKTPDEKWAAMLQKLYGVADVDSLTDDQKNNLIETMEQVKARKAAAATESAAKK